MAAGAALPAPQPPPSCPRGAQEGARADSCPRHRPSLSPQTLSLARAASPARVGGQSGDPGAPWLRSQANPASLTSSSRLESLGAALAFGSDHGPPLPARRRRPRAPARPAPLPLCHRPSARLGSAPLGSGSPRHRGGRRLFLRRGRGSPPPPPDVRRGGSTEVGGGPRRPAPEGAATRRDPHAYPLPARGLGPPPLPVPCRPAPCSRELRHRAGRWGGGGTPGPGTGESDSPGLSEVSPKANRAGWAAGLGNGAKGIPTLRLLERRRAGHFRASIRGFFSGRTRVVCLLAPNSSPFLGPNFH